MKVPSLTEAPIFPLWAERWAYNLNKPSSLLLNLLFHLTVVLCNAVLL